MAEDLDLLRS